MFYSNLKSFFLLLAVALTVLLILSCSSVNKNLSPEGKIRSQTAFDISSFTLSVNGEKIQHFDTLSNQKEISGIDALIFGAKNYGVFVVSTEKFKKSTQAGTMSSGAINFEINELKVSVNPKDGSLTNITEPIPIWVRQMHNRKSRTFSFDSQPYSTLNNSSFLETLPWPDYSIALESSESNFGNNIKIVEEQIPLVVGGLKSIMQKVKYPKQAIENNIYGIVRIKFKVGEDGNLYDFEFLNRLGSGCDFEALQAIKSSKFKPAQFDGHPSPSSLVIPISFRPSK